MDRLIHLFGYVNTMHIIQDIQPPIPGAGIDRLVFKESTSGVLFVKKSMFTVIKGLAAASVRR